MDRPAPAPDAAAAPDADVASAADALVRVLGGGRRVVALTGAGVSTASGIPDYRDETGAWKRRPPVVLADFLAHEATRRRYWARSLVGWPAFHAATPNAAHAALARLEAAGVVADVVTQNVDGLHQRAGSARVVDLHGRLDTVVCLVCGARASRASVQARLEAAFPHLAAREARRAPDGDADLEGDALAAFAPPECASCRGTLKPDVVFFGESVPAARVADAYARVAAADALLVVGTSLKVFSGFRFVRAAAERGTPVAILNRGVTRGDALAAVKADGPCGPVLDALARRLAPA
ncbi:MAG: NAD-dependent protein deacetylase [Planctomycetota bacterium]